MSDQLQIFNEIDYPKESMLSLLEVLAKILALQEKEKVLMEIEVPLLAKQLISSANSDQIFLSGKMLKEHSPQTMVRTFGQLSKPLPTLGVIDLNGNCLIQAGFYPKIERESTLSDILQTEVEDKYFLSEKSVKRIIRQTTSLQQIQSTHDTQQIAQVRTLRKVTKFHLPQKEDMK